MSKSILNKLRPGLLWKKETGKTLWEAGTIFEILLAVERSWTPAKSKKCSKLKLHFEKLPDRLTLPYADLDSLVMELPSVFTLLPTGIQSLILSQLSLHLLKAGTGDGSIQSTQKWNYCYASIASVVTKWSISGELRWPSSGRSLHWQGRDDRLWDKHWSFFLFLVLISCRGWELDLAEERLSLIALRFLKVCWQNQFLLVSTDCLEQVPWDCIPSQGMWVKTFQSYSMPKLSVLFEISKRKS